MTDPNQEPPASSGREWIDAALDRGVDPLDDPQIVQRLEAQPQLLDEFVRERELLRQIEGASDVELHRTGVAGRSVATAPRRPLAAAAGLVLLAAAAALGVALLFPSDPRPAKRTPRVLSTQLQEHPPFLRAAATYVVYETLAHTTSFEITTYEQKSQPR
ncbi:MAG: hypothetical protein AB8H80_02575 [Planctomycetota bacterium]